MTGIDTRDLVGAELAFVYGPLSFQSEYYVNYINRITGADCKAQGAYAYVSYFLTGENRPYDRTRGIFGRVKPYENFFRVRDENGVVPETQTQTQETPADATTVRSIALAAAASSRPHATARSRSPSTSGPPVRRTRKLCEPSTA